ncbi:MAG: hypothetical protein VW450_05775 [Chloroflexota bacterium]
MAQQKQDDERSGGAQLPWLPGERFELALDAERGALHEPRGGQHVLTLTNHRAIKLSAAASQRTTAVVPLARLSAVEVQDASRPSAKLSQGLLLAGVGVFLGWLSWVITGVLLVPLLLGGLPLLAAVYLLSAYAFPDAEGQLVLHAGGFTLCQPLRTAYARRDAYLVAHRIYELMAAANAGAPAPAEAQDAYQSEPAACPAPTPASGSVAVYARPMPAPVQPVSYAPPQPAHGAPAAPAPVAPAPPPPASGPGSESSTPAG